MRWHLLTGEYPPVAGGVADYTRLVACGLAAAGDGVTVWTPGLTASRLDDDGVTVQSLPDHFGPRSLACLTSTLRRETRPHRILLQYVPHAFGWKGANVPFCLWLRAQTLSPVWAMFHEVAYPIDRRQRLVLNALGAVTRGMAALVASAAERIFVSIPAWQPQVRPSAAPGVPVEWLPVPTVIPVAAVDPRQRQMLRQRYAQGRPLLGHVGTYGELQRPLVAGALPAIVSGSGANVLLLGRGSETMAAECLARHPGLTGRLHAAGTLDAAVLSQHISACDGMFQPYPDGISSRRTSAMAALAHGRPIVTTGGALTENIWGTTPAVILCAVGDADAAARASAALLADAADRDHRGHAARALYDMRFDVRHTLARLRGDDGPAAMLRAVS